jgi:hypothetical protein
MEGTLYQRKLVFNLLSKTWSGGIAF